VVEKGYIDRLVVSTDDEDIAKVSQRLGAEVPFLRPAPLASDQAKTADCLLHAIHFFEQQGQFYDAVVILQPTSPLRREEDLKNTIDFFDREEKNSLITVYREDAISELIMYDIDENGMAIPFDERHCQGIRRQECRLPYYVRNGAVYIVSTSYLKEKKQMISEKPLAYVMPKSLSINVDDHEDLILLEKMLIKENIESAL